MNPDWFNEIVDDWSARIPLTPTQKANATDLLAAISIANGGELLPDVDVDDGVASAHARLRALQALARRVNRYAASMAAGGRRRRHRLPGPAGPAPVLAGIERSRWAYSIDVNTADVAELASLPRIGPALARRIVIRRQERGLLQDLEELDDIPGMGAERMGVLAERCHVGTSSSAPFTSERLAGFVARPDFDDYLDLVAGHGGGFRWPERLAADPARSLLDELAGCLEELRTSPGTATADREGTLASQALAEVELRQQASAGPEPVEGVEVAVVLRDRQYQPFLESLVAGAGDRLWVAMFFMVYVAEDSHPTDRVIAELVAAHQRGVDVRVVLDRDRPGEVFHSRIINDGAFQYLTDQGLAVRYDTEDRLMHSKMVLRDDVHVVVGSHNWTAGSFVRYDDTSVYFQSVDLASSLAEWFQELWDASV